ncbi:hypothetical protein GCM10020367_18280 [Streptomyces sannanensis]|uniref:Uncharacterized protein n=1 Tax=Streptomyces sannanensis TaxID=285536 RepID=A0ABP6S8C1_9ACTN
MTGRARTLLRAPGRETRDELQIHLVPVLPGGGVRLFGVRLFKGTGDRTREFETTRVIGLPGLAHLRIRPVK